MKFTFVAAAIFLISVQSHASAACKILFGQSTYKSKIQQVEESTARVTENSLKVLKIIEDLLRMPVLNNQNNHVVEMIVETNNTILDAVTVLQEKKSLFASRSERERFESRMADLKNLFVMQGFPIEIVDQLFAIRLKIAEADQKEGQIPKATIGFLSSGPSLAESAAASQKTIGFLKTPLLETPYGRMGERKDEKSQKKPLGFLAEASSEKTETAKPMASIGFLGADSAVDVGYRMRTEFDVQTGYFVAVKEDGHQIGFTTSK